MALDEAAWAEVERLYVESDETLARIAARFGIEPGQISARAKKKGLPPRRGCIRRTTPAAAPAEPVRSTPPRTPARPSAVGDPAKAARDVLISRLYRALAKKIKHLEDRMDTTDGADPQISEQQTRELNAAVSAFEKVTEVHTDADKARAAVERAVTITSRADLERLRRDLAERLHRVWGGKKR